jgi:hypothetical protein
MATSVTTLEHSAALLREQVAVALLAKVIGSQRQDGETIAKILDASDIKVESPPQGIDILA